MCVYVTLQLTVMYSALIKCLYTIENRKNLTVTTVFIILVFTMEVDENVKTAYTYTEMNSKISHAVNYIRDDTPTAVKRLPNGNCKRSRLSLF